jgi:exodeoxyribonuclease VII large subunit
MMAGPQADVSDALTVSAVTARIKDRLAQDFRNICVVGEIGQCSRAASGHVYLTLKDDGAVLKAVVWRGAAARLRFDVEVGVEVIARGSIDVYPPRGDYQLIVSRMEPCGRGALQAEFERLKARLAAEGMFDAAGKKPLPAMPGRIGVVTSPTGAAVRDIINAVRRRCPAVDVYVMPVRVQGVQAAGEIAAAVERLNEMMPELDVLIVGRGGGSAEDLWAFNEEVVARAIHASAIPVVSAVGHETDFSIADFVADVRAATPSEAAELVVPDSAELRDALKQRSRRLTAALDSIVVGLQRRVDALATRPVLADPLSILRERAQRIDSHCERMEGVVAARLAVVKENLKGCAQRLDALSPLAVLERGYSLTMGEDGRLLRSAADVAIGQQVKTRLHCGSITSSIVGIAPDDADSSPGTAP